MKQEKRSSKLLRPKERQWRCLCEGAQEKDYLKHLEKLLRDQEYSVRFDTKPFAPSSKGIQTALLQVDYGKCVLFDHDGRDMAFRATLQSCKKSTIPAFSNRCFDLWLLLHKSDYHHHVSQNDAYVEKIRTEFNLGAEADIKTEENRQHILDQISLEDVKSAVHRAKILRKEKLESDRKEIAGHVYYDNPDITVHIFIEEVFKVCGMPLT